MSELFEQLKAQQELRKQDYQAGWKAGYAQKEKEIEEAQRKAVELEVKLEDEADQRRYEEAEDYRQR